MTNIYDNDNNDQVNINEEEALDVQNDEDDEDFIELMEGNNLFKDNWEPNMSHSDDNTDSLNKQEVCSLLKKCRLFICVTKKSITLSTYFNQLRKKSDVKRNVASDCVTRWNSTYHMITSFLATKAIIIKFFDDKYVLNLRRELTAKLISMELSDRDWNLLTHLGKVLERFSLATEILLGRTYPTIGLFYYSVHYLHHFLKKKDYHHEVNTLKEMLRNKLHSYFYADEEQLMLLKVSSSSLAYYNIHRM